jgi:hypothetical protein
MKQKKKKKTQTQTKKKREFVLNQEVVNIVDYL